MFHGRPVVAGASREPSARTAHLAHLRPAGADSAGQKPILSPPLRVVEWGAVKGFAELAGTESALRPLPADTEPVGRHGRNSRLQAPPNALRLLLWRRTARWPERIEQLPWRWFQPGCHPTIGGDLAADRLERRRRPRHNPGHNVAASHEIPLPAVFGWPARSLLRRLRQISMALAKTSRSAHPNEQRRPRFEGDRHGLHRRGRSTVARPA
jgi:hypothetical protein